MAASNPHRTLRCTAQVLLPATARDATPFGSSAPRALQQLRGAGLQLMLLIRDSEALATAQLTALGWSNLFCGCVYADAGGGSGERQAAAELQASIKAAGSDPQQVKLCEAV